jgi:hypothetical protein
LHRAQAEVNDRASDREAAPKGVTDGRERGVFLRIRSLNDKAANDLNGAKPEGQTSATIGIVAKLGRSRVRYSVMSFGGDDMNHARPAYSIIRIARNRARNCADRFSNVAEHSLRP